jgi:outer membrane protein OmpA-like peptidoglycan-associated protein
MNTNSHEVVSQVLPNGDLLVTANYPEKLGANATGDAGMQTTDLFYLRNLESDYQIIHFPEPVNSIFTEADPWMAKDKSYLLFVSDREGHVGEYHKKGWKWNDSFWGNTDVYVSQKVGDSWSVPQNLGSLVNTPGAERTPWMSEDGLTLYLSSNGYQPGKTDLDVYAFKRKNSNSWTEWDGPYAITDANTAYDDWGYKEVKSGEAFLASAAPRGFKPTQGGKSGDGGFRETNFRPGYELFGLQVAALNAEFDTNIFQLKKSDSPVFILQDVFFDFNSFRINKKFEEYLTLMADELALNPEVVIQIEGYTDNVGAAHYNLELSLNRADAVKAFLIRKGVTQEIQTFGFGADRPITDNANALNRGKNRRVEIYLK